MRHMKQFSSKAHKMQMSKVSPNAGSRAGSVDMGYGDSHSYVHKSKAPPPPPKKSKSDRQSRR